MDVLVWGLGGTRWRSHRTKGGPDVSRWSWCQATLSQRHRGGRAEAMPRPVVVDARHSRPWINKLVKRGGRPGATGSKNRILPAAPPPRSACVAPLIGGPRSLVYSASCGIRTQHPPNAAWPQCPYGHGPQPTGHHCSYTRRGHEWAAEEPGWSKSSHSTFHQDVSSSGIETALFQVCPWASYPSVSNLRPPDPNYDHTNVPFPQCLHRRASSWGQKNRHQPPSSSKSTSRKKSLPHVTHTVERVW